MHYTGKSIFSFFNLIIVYQLFSKVMCRGKAEIDDSLKQKISMFCMVDIKQVRIFLCNQMFQLSFVVNILPLLC